MAYLMSLLRRCITSSAVLAGLILASVPASGQDFLPVDEALELTAYSTGSELVLDWVIEPEHYMYRDVTAVEPVDPAAGAPSWGPVALSNHDVIRYDPTFDERLAVYYDYLTVRVPVASDEPVAFRVTYQGCAEAGLCYPPQTREVTFDPSGGQSEVTGAPGAAPAGAGSGGSGGSVSWFSGYSGNGLAEFLAAAHPALAAGVFLLLGIGLIFTPCVLPMIPIASALVLGENRPSTGRAFVVALSYVLGMSLTYASAGAVVASLGAAGNIQAALQQPWLLSVFAILFAVLALAIFGVFTLQTPGPLQSRIIALQNRLQQGRPGSALGMGALSALVVSPCITAPLAGALIYISATGNTVLGFLALFALGMGMGLPLLVIAVGGARWLPRSGSWMVQVKVFFGVLLLAVAIWLLGRWVPEPIALGLYGLMALGYGGWQLDRARRAVRERPEASVWPTRSVAALLALYGAIAITGSLQGQSDPLRPLAAFSDREAESETPFSVTADVAELNRWLADAAGAGEPVLLDLTAEWCVSCRRMEREIYQHREVQAALDDHRWLQLDITRFSDAHQAWLDQYGLFGPPSVLVFDESGQRRPDRTLQGEVSRQGFMAHMGLI